jgi:DNA-binding beta-propeller fold protein YncE
MRNATGLLLALIAVVIGGPALAQNDELSGTLIVLNKGDNTASFIDLESGDTLATLPTGTNPHEIVVTSDGRFAVGTNYRGGNSLTVFDVADLSVARTIDLTDHPAPHGIQLMPGEEAVIVTTEGSNETLVIEIATGRIVSVVDTLMPGSHMVAIPDDARVAYTANTAGNSVSIIDVGTGRTTRTLDVPPQPEAIATNGGGTDIWVGSNEAGIVSVVDAATGRTRMQLPGFSWPYRILLIDDEQRVVIPDARRETLAVFDTGSGEKQREITLAGAGPQGVIPYRDDGTLFVALSRQSKVLAIHSETLETLREYATGAGPDGLGYSPLELR